MLNLIRAKDAGKTMGSKTSFRFVLDVKNKPRAILSISERPKTFDLTLNLRPAALLREPSVPIYEQLPGSKFQGKTTQIQRYSIHPTHDSNSYNTITHTLVHDTGQYRFYHKTSAIKSQKKFAELYTRRFPNLDADTFDIKNNSGQTIKLGHFDPTAFTLVMTVFVGDSSLDFDASMPDINIRQLRTTLFNLVLVWSFLTIRALPTGFLSHAFLPTNQDLSYAKDLIDVFSPFEQGWTAAECLDRHNRQRALCLQELRDEWTSAIPDSSWLQNYFNTVEFFKHGVKDTPAWKNRISRMAGLGLGRKFTLP